MTAPVAAMTALGCRIAELARTASDGGLAVAMRRIARETFPTISDTAQAETLIAMTGLWAEQGAQRIVVDGRFAASLMATRINPEAADDLAPPWPCFLLDIPPGLLPRDPTLGDIGHVLVSWRLGAAGSVAMLFVGRTGVDSVTLAAGHSPREFLLGVKHPVLHTLATNGSQFELRSRVIEVIARYVAAVIAACATRDRLEPASHAARVAVAKASPVHRGGNGQPDTRTYILKPSVPVPVDARPYVRAYLAGNGTSPAVQSFVMGHIRRWPGERGLSDPRLIRIEPFWRGPADAPIAVRAHRLSAR